jgi:hypothetical protein
MRRHAILMLDFVDHHFFVHVRAWMHEADAHS